MPQVKHRAPTHPVIDAEFATQPPGGPPSHRHVWVMATWSDDVEPRRLPVFDAEPVANALARSGFALPGRAFLTTGDGRQFDVRSVRGDDLRDGSLVRLSQVEFVPGGGGR